MEIVARNNYLFARDGQQYGPVDGSRLIEMAQSGEVVSTDHLWTDGMEDWLPTGSFSQLADVFSSNGNSSNTAPGSPADPEKTEEAKKQEEARRQEELKRQAEARRKAEIDRDEAARIKERIRREQEIRSQYPGTRFSWLYGFIGLALILTGLFFYFERQEVRASSYVIESLESFKESTDYPDDKLSGFEVGQITVIGLLAVTVLGYLAVSMLILYRAWRYVQDVPRVATTPGKAVGFMMIPFYNCLWIGTAYKQWHEEYERKCSISKQEANPAIRSWIFRMPKLVLILFAPVTHFLMTQQISKAVNHLVEIRIAGELESEV